MEKSALAGYPMLMTEIERRLLDRLLELESAVKTLPMASPKPNLVILFQQIDELAHQLPRGTAPDLLH